jgi:ankyrin repeat protein
MTTLHHAASKDKYEVVKWLIQKENVEQNIRTEFNELAIDVCSSKNKNIINYLKNFMQKTPSS